MNKKWYLGLAILIILLLDTACILFLLDKYAPQEAFNLFEAFFRCSMSWNKDSLIVQDAEAYFFEIEGRDPPSEFMDRFAKHPIPVKKGSDFVEDDFDKNTGTLFSITSWRWIGWGWLTRDHAEIHGGYEDRGSGYYATYIFKRDKKGWALDNVGPILHFDNFILPPPP